MEKPGLFGRLAAAIMDHPRLAVVLILVLTLTGGGLGLLLEVNPNMLALLPEKDPTAQAIRRINAEEGGTNLVTIAARAKDPLALDAFMKDLEGRLESRDDVEYALYDLDADIAWRLGLLQLSAEELTTLRTRLGGALAMGPAATNPFMAARLLDLGPLTEKLTPGQATAVLPAPEGMARMVVRPRGIAYDVTFARPFMHALYGTLDAAEAAHPGVEVVWVGGAHRHAVEDVENITADLQWTGMVSFVLVFGLIIVAYRNLRALVLLFVPLVIANIWAVGFAGVTIGSLNTFTSFFPAILVGLGVDFSIHLYGRYREERAHSGDLKQAVVRAWDKVGPPAVTAALTSVGGFCALWAAGFKGFRQLGTILAGGVSFCLITALVVLPLLILWLEKQPHAVADRRFRLPDRRMPPTYRLAPLGLLLMATLSMAAALLASRVEFEYDMSELRPEGLAYADLGEDERAIAETSYAPVVLSFPDAESLAAQHTRLTEAVAKGELEHVSGVLDVHTALPIDQDRRIALLREIATLAQDPNLQYLPAAVQQNLGRLASLDLRPLSGADLPPALQHLLGASEGRHRMMLVPRGNMWDLRNNLALREEVAKWLPGVEAAGEYLALAVLYSLVRHDTPRVAGLALLVVLLLSWADLRSLPRALGALGALIAGICWAGASLTLFDVKLSLVNFVGIPILMGIGVDVIIHLLHRLFEEGPGRVRHALSTTGVASGLSTATTVMSFAALSVASAEGVRNLGMLITVGLSVVTLVGLSIVPLGWMTTWKIKGDLPTTWPPPEE